MSRFEFATAGRILFGPGTATELPAIAAVLGKRPLLVTGKGHRRTEGIAGIKFSVGSEPTIELVLEGVRRFRDAGCDLVVAVGGGSAIDAGKAIAAVAANPGDLLDYLEIIGKAQPLECPPYPFIAVPTTAGTGAEVTRNSVLGSPLHGLKVSLRSPLMLPRVAIVDPDLTLGLPPAITASTGLDALTQLIEPFVSSRASPLTDGFCRSGIPAVARSLLRACEAGGDREARTDMSRASLLGGMALANAGLGVVHGFAAPIGGMFDAPHGAVCAALLASGMEANIVALRTRMPGSEALNRYREIACMLTGVIDAGPEEGVKWIRTLVKRLEIPRLRQYGIQDTHVGDISEKAARSSSMKANPLTLTTRELEEILEDSL